MQLSRGRQAVPGADEAYTHGLWRGIFDCLRPRRDVVDAVDADEAIDGCSEPCLWRLQLNITRQDFVGGCGTGRRRRSDVLYAIDAGGGVVADLDAWRGASLIACALCGAPGPRHYKPYIRRALRFSNERRGDYRRLS